MTRPSQHAPYTKINPAVAGPLWSAYLADKSDVAARNAVAELYLPYVESVAKMIRIALADQVDADDLRQEGVFGLLDAVAAYDPGRGYAFETFAAFRIRGAMLDGVRGFDHIPRLARRRARQVAEAAAAFADVHGRPPADHELAAAIGGPHARADRVIADAAVARVQVSNFSAIRAADDSDDVGILGSTRSVVPAFLADPAAGPAAAAERNDAWDGACLGLDCTDRTIVTLYYRESLTMKETGEALGLSESRVSQRHTSIVARLKASDVAKVAGLFNLN
ncbi:MAG: polymerase sigma factor, FliA/WhiG family [Phycisphaerales bacterium]|nr:polymerase sigma factor, FliA/WhiG family [Phycisphaerales bacterium]